MIGKDRKLTVQALCSLVGMFDRSKFNRERGKTAFKQIYWNVSEFVVVLFGLVMSIH